MIIAAELECTRPNCTSSVCLGFELCTVCCLPKTPISKHKAISTFSHLFILRAKGATMVILLLPQFTNIVQLFGIDEKVTSSIHILMILFAHIDHLSE